MFLVMAVVLGVVALTGSSLAPAFSVSIGARIEQVLRPILDGLAWIPDPVVGIGLLAVAVGAIALSTRRGSRQAENEEPEEMSCHAQEHPAHEAK
jgi:hypothetical protein